MLARVGISVFTTFHVELVRWTVHGEAGGKWSVSFLGTSRLLVGVVRAQLALRGQSGNKQDELPAFPRAFSESCVVQLQTLVSPGLLSAPGTLWLWAR